VLVIWECEVPTQEAAAKIIEPFLK
jgi:hypothetical protein